MPYATRPDLEALFGPSVVAELLLRHADPDAALAAALANAAAEIDSYLAGIYATPVAEAPAVLVRVACVMARYNLWGRDLAKDHPAYLAYRDEISTLTSIRDGRMNLPAPLAGSELPAADTGRLTVRARSRQFGAGVLERMP